MIDRSAQRAGTLSHALGTFVNNAYATYTRDEIIAALSLALDIEKELPTPDVDNDDEMHCETCAHTRAQHAFFPGGDSAPLCVAAYKPEDSALIDHTCDCDGFILFPKA